MKENSRDLNCHSAKHLKIALVGFSSHEPCKVLDARPSVIVDVLSEASLHQVLLSSDQTHAGSMHLHKAENMSKHEINIIDKRVTYINFLKSDLSV